MGYNSASVKDICKI